jgi:hypothetical protein
MSALQRIKDKAAAATALKESQKSTPPEPAATPLVAISKKDPVFKKKYLGNKLIDIFLGFKQPRRTS